MLAAFGAMDITVNTDRHRWPLIQVSFEVLVMMGYSLVRGCRNDRGQGDWSRPEGAGNWGTKVDGEESWRTDPPRSEQGTIRVMSAEEEESEKSRVWDTQPEKERVEFEGVMVAPD